MLIPCLYPNFYDYYYKGKQIGFGAFAEIYECRLQNDNEYKLVKIQKKNDLGKREAKILIYLQSKNISIVPLFYDYYSSFSKTFIVMEYIRGVNLLEFKKNNPNLTYKEKNSIALDIVKNVRKLQKYHIVHRDLKAENIMICSDENSIYKTKIIDFGLSLIKKNLYRFNIWGRKGTPLYMPPEIWANQYYNATCDSFSLGVLLYFLFTDKFPYNIKLIYRYKYNNYLLMRYFKKEIESIDFDLIEKEKWRRFIKYLLEFDKTKRLLIKDLV